jgi:cysteine desulfurase
MDPIYLDNAASTRISPEALAAMTEVLQTAWGNPSASHPQGALARRYLAEARARLGAALGDPAGALGELVFTSGCTEADAIGVLGAARARGGDGAIAISAIEHPAVAATAAMAGERGAPVIVLPVDELGRVDLARAREAITADTAVVAIVLVQNEIGVVQPAAELAAIARERAPGVHVHVDAAQALGHVPVDVGALGADSIALAGHKVHAPRGVGALWLRRGARVEPLWGGGGQQGGLRSGTEDAPSAVAFAIAVERAVAALADATARWGAMRAAITAALDGAGLAWREVAAGAARSPHIVSIALRGVPAGALRNVAASRGVYLSTGSACAERDNKPSATLAAVGIGPDWGVARLSFGHDTTLADVERGATIVAEIARELAGSRHV